nr:MAG TPA: hypothetical protein [Caudoviricetes sp.]
MEYMIEFMYSIFIPCFHGFRYLGIVIIYYSYEPMKKIISRFKTITKVPGNKKRLPRKEKPGRKETNETVLR